MNPILKDELVHKYFGCRIVGTCGRDCEKEMALRVLDAMVAPLKQGDAFLIVKSVIGSELAWWNGCPCNEVHVWCLRLPDAFQEPDYEKELEEKIMQFRFVSRPGIQGVIDLARKAERQKMEREAKR